MKVHLVYKTTLITTGEFYIGVHSTDNIEDGYLGSGKIIRASLKKHGRDAFARELLAVCESRDEALQRERELVSADVLLDPLCLNIAIGGDGPMFSRPLTNDHKEKISRSLKGRPAPNRGIPCSDSRRQKMREKIPHNKGQPMSEEQRRLLSERNQFRSKQVSINGVVYPSLREAVRTTGLAKTTITNRINNPKWQDYFYL
jgi:hypothetical protein